MSQIRDYLSRTRDGASRSFLPLKAKTRTAFGGASVKDEDDGTLAGRIRIAMVSAGIPTPADLARKAKLHRQAVHKYLNGENEKLTPEKLYKLADALKVNPRWLAFGPPESPVPPRTIDPAAAELIQIRETLEKAESRDAKVAADNWVTAGRDLVRILTPTSSANPFVPPVKGRKERQK